MSAAAPRPVDSQEVLERFQRSRSATQKFEEWRSDPRRRTVAPAVLSHRTATLLALTPEEVIETAHRTEHALGEVKKSNADRVPAIRDWHADFALTHVLNFVTEEVGHLPTYQEFREVCANEPFRAMLWQPAQQEISRLTGQGIEPSIARDAMRWRVGNAYYSFVRESYVLAVLRSEHLDARTHPLADALFRVDFWVENVNIDLFVGNSRFRSSTTGRKLRSADLLADAEPPFRPLSIDLPAASVFGVIHLPDMGQLSATADRIRAAVQDSVR